MTTAILSPETAFNLINQQQVKSPLTAENAKDPQRIKDAAREFEAVFFAEALKPMFESIEVNELFGGGKGEEIFRGFMLQEYGKEIAKKDITGIQTQVQHKLLEIQEQRTEANLSPAQETQQIIDLDILEEN